MDGQIVIGTSLDTKQLQQQLKQQERELQRYEKEAEKLTTTKAKIEVDLSNYEKEVAEIQKRTDESLKFAQTEDQVKFTLAMEQTELDQVNLKYEDTFIKNKQINDQIEENVRNQALVRGEIEKTNSELKKAKGFDSIKDAIKNIGKQTEKNINKVKKWALAIFGIRAMYMMVRNAVNTITASDEKLKNDIDYIKAVFAYTLEPAIRKIVEWAKLLMQYLGYIVYKWTGKDIFANADKGLKKANKQAKELKKQIAGFDEVNIMSDNKSSDSGNIAGTIKPLEEGQVPKWLDWIVKHGPLIISILGGIAGALGALKLGIGGIKALGIGIMVAGLIYGIQGLLNYLKDPSWFNFGQIVQGIGVFIVGLGVAVAGLPAIIIGACVLILGTILKYWDQIKSFLQGGIDWLANQSQWIHDNCGDLLGGLYDMIVGTLQNILKWFDGMFTNMKRTFDGLITFLKGVFTGDWKKVWEGLQQIIIGVFNTITAPIRNVFEIIKNIVVNVVSAIARTIASLGAPFKAIVNFFIDGLNFLIRGMNKFQWDVPDWVPFIGGQKWGINIQEIPRLARGGIVNNPGSGVMMGNYIAGERGREAILPLTDPSAMSALGQEIARYCNINNAVELNVDSRRLGRVMQQSQNASNFARNV